jgi:hypothetical protein
VTVNDVPRLTIPPLAAIAGTLAAAAIAVLLSPLLFVPLLVAAGLVSVGLAWWLTELGPMAAPATPAAPAPAAAAPVAAPVAVAAPAEPGADPRFEPLVAAHLELARALLEVRDLSSSPTAITRIDRALGDAGVAPVPVIEGSRFDYRTQHAVAAVATDDPARDDTVAQLLVPGYAMGPHVLRPPQVSVFRAGLDVNRG